MADASNILETLQSATERLRRTRAVEAAATAAAGVAAATACFQTAALIAPKFPNGGTLLAGLTVLAAAAVWAFKDRLKLDAPTAAITAMVIAAAAVAAVWTGPAAIDTAWLLILIPIAAALAATARWLRRPAVSAAAALLDARCNLHQQLTAAAELAADPAPDPALTEFVCQRASDAFTRAGGPAQPLWQRTRATAAALGLLVAVCAMLALLPPLQSPSEAAALARLEAAVRTMPQADKSRLLQQLRRQRAQSPQAQADLIEKVEQALQNGDAAELQRLIERLKSAGIDPSTLADSDLLAAAGMTGWQGAGNAAAPSAGAEQLPARQSPPPAPQSVRVYDPAYAKLLVARDGSPEQTPAVDAPGTFVDRSDAWQAARRRAENALRSNPQDLPPEYRRMIRNYFADR